LFGWEPLELKRVMSGNHAVRRSSKIPSIVSRRDSGAPASCPRDASTSAATRSTRRRSPQHWPRAPWPALPRRLLQGAAAGVLAVAASAEHVPVDLFIKEFVQRVEARYSVST